MGSGSLQGEVKIVVRRSSGLLVGGLLVVVMAACASSVKSGSGDVATSQEDLTGGEAGTPFNTGAIKIRYGCTATMIGSNQILTAAHCVALMKPPINGTSYGPTEKPWTTAVDPKYAAGQSIGFTNSPTAETSSNWFTSTILGVDLSESYMSTCASGCQNNFSITSPFPLDLAFITINDTFPDSFGYSATFSGMGTGYGDAVTETGYGCTAGLNGPSSNPAFFKYANATLLDPSVAANLSAPGWGISSANLQAFTQRYFVTAGMSGGGSASLCPGDSGGPLFKGPLTQVYSQVVGVNAYYFFPPVSEAGISSYNLFARMDTQDAQDLLTTTAIEYPPPSGRGSPINNNVDPISSVFPLSTVGLETPGTPGCTGVLLTSNSVLTAEHCNVGPTTIAHLYVSDPKGGSLPTVDIPADSSATVATQGVTCQTSDLTFPQSCFLPNKSGVGSHNADLAVLTLSQTVPIAFSPVVLGAKGYGAQGLPAATLPTLWEVTTGGPQIISSKSREEWAPVTYEQSSDTDQPQGYFFVHSIYGMLGDYGGPVFQAPSLSSDDAGTDGGIFTDMKLLGLVADIPPCLSGDTCDHLNMVVTVTQPDNYDWLVGLGGSPVSALATFGASH